MAAWKRAGTCSLRLSLRFALSVSPLASSRLFSCPPHYLTWTNRSTSRWSPLSLSFFTCFASVCALFHHPSFQPLLPLCLFMLLLLLLPDIFRDELQSTAGGKKKQRGSSFSNVRPASFPLTFMRTSPFPCRTSSIP